MRLSISLPGENRQDPSLTDQVKAEHSLGRQSGRWIKALYPPEALQDIKKLDNAARAYHAAVTLPFDNGIGILPAALVMDYATKMREFAAKRESLIESKFLADPGKWLTWALDNHNGTFDPDNYPGVEKLPNDHWGMACEEFRSAMREKFNFRTEPLPVPDAGHFTNTLRSLLGTDAESVDVRVADAMQEGMRELMRRLIAPVKAMAEKLVEQPKVGKDGTVKSDILFRDSLIGNLKEIAELAPKLNIAGDPVIDGFADQIGKLAAVKPDTLRDDRSERALKAAAAADLLKRLEGYKI